MASRINRQVAKLKAAIAPKTTLPKRQRATQPISDIERARIRKEAVVETIQAIVELKEAIGDEGDIRLHTFPFRQAIARYLGLRSNALDDVMMPYGVRGEIRLLVAEVRTSWLKHCHAAPGSRSASDYEAFKPLSWHRQHNPMYVPAKVA